MARNILILGASYGSLLGTKLLMAGHNVTLVCRKKTAELINRDGTKVRIKLRDEAMHRAISSRDLPGTLDAVTPGDVDVSREHARENDFGIRLAEGRDPREREIENRRQRKTVRRSHGQYFRLVS